MGISILVPGVNWASNNLGRVTPTGNVPVQAIAIVGEDNIVNSGQFVANLFPVFTTQRGVTWSITDGSSYADIDQNGNVTGKPGAIASSVTIRATSSSNAEVWAEKTISVTTGDIVYYDYIQSDGNSYILIPGYYLLGGKIISRTTFTTANGYVWGGQHHQNAGATKVGAYKRNAGDIGVVGGAANYLATNITPAAGVIYRYEFTTSTTESGTNAVMRIYNESTGSQVWSRTSNTNVYLNSDISLFAYGYNESGKGSAYTPGNFSANKLYGFEIYDSNDTKLVDLKPVTMDGVPGVLDDVSKSFYANSGEGTLTAGND